MTAPPWGDAGAKIHFGDEDQGTLQLQYKGQFRMTCRDIGSGPGRHRQHDELRLPAQPARLHGRLERQGQPVRPDGVRRSERRPRRRLRRELRHQRPAARRGGALQLQRRLQAERRQVQVQPLPREPGGLRGPADPRPLALHPHALRRARATTASRSGATCSATASSTGWTRWRDARRRRGTIAPSSSLRYSARGHVTLLDPENALRLQGHVPRQEEGPDRRRRLPVRAGRHLRRHRHAARRRRTTRAGRWTASSSTRSSGSAPSPPRPPTRRSISTTPTQGANPDTGAIGLIGEKNGWYAKARLPPPRHARCSSSAATRSGASPACNNVFDQIVDWYGVGANYYVWGQNLKLTAEWSKTDFDQEGTFTSVQSTRTTKDFNQFVGPDAVHLLRRHRSGGAGPPSPLPRICRGPQDGGSRGQTERRSTHDEASCWPHSPWSSSAPPSPSPRRSRPRSRPSTARRSRSSSSARRPTG